LEDAAAASALVPLAQEQGEHQAPQQQLVLQQALPGKGGGTCYQEMAGQHRLEPVPRPAQVMLVPLLPVAVLALVQQQPVLSLAPEELPANQLES